MSAPATASLGSIGALVLSLAVAVGGCGGDGGARLPQSHPPGTVAPLHAAAAATVYRDPVTGRFGPPPPGAVATTQAPGLSTSTTGLKEVAGPRGGWMVDLQGRFQHQVQALRAPDGTPSAECLDPQDNR